MTEGVQLALDFEHRTALTGDEFLVADCNAAAVAWIDRWPDWPASGLAIQGPGGCGKSHLVQVFLARSHGRVLVAGDLVRRDALVGATNVPAFVLDDADLVIEAIHEEALLHLYNDLTETGRRILFTAKQPPARWTIRLPDLRSRLNAMPAVAIGAPDEALISAVLVKLFADRQLKVSPEVVSYMLARMERSFAAARELVAAIDERALAERREITVPLVRDVVDRNATR